MKDMRDRQVELLTRMLREADGLDGPNYAASRDFGGGNWSRTIGALIGVAACLMIFLRPQIPVGNGSFQAQIPFNVRYLPSVGSSTDGLRTDCLQSSSAESCSVLALLRRFSSECQCLVWDVHRWEGGDLVKLAAPGEALELLVDLEETSPTVDQVVVFAVAKNSSDLPQSVHDADALLECLVHTSTEPDNGGALANADAVGRCLSSNVMIVPEIIRGR